MDELTLTRLKNNDPSLQSLNLDSNLIGDQGAGLLAEALKSNSTLQSLYLRCNNIGVQGAGLLAEALKSNSTLQSLDLGYNNIGVQGAGLLAESLTINPYLKELTLSFKNEEINNLLEINRHPEKYQVEYDQKLCKRIKYLGITWKLGKDQVFPKHLRQDIRNIWISLSSCPNEFSQIPNELWIDEIFHQLAQLYVM